MTDYANINDAKVDEIYNSSYRLCSQAMTPMYDALKGDRLDLFQQLSSNTYRDLRRDFTAAINKYNAVIVLLKDRYLAAFVVLPLQRIQ
ncbi:MAG: hypothetical protein ACSLEN_09165 [Candidatus Malihini olakiniferum]